MTSDEAVLAFMKDVMPLYIDTSKTYAQLAAAGLVLSIGFREKVLGARAGTHVTIALASAWACLLASIAGSAFYQWIAVRLIQQFYQEQAGDDTLRFPLTVSWLQPGYVYGVMVLFFFAGGVLLVYASVRQLLSPGTGRSAEGHEPDAAIPG